MEPNGIPRIPFLAMLNLPKLSRLTNDILYHDPMWMVVLAKIPSYIRKLQGKSGEDLERI